MYDQNEPHEFQQKDPVTDTIENMVYHMPETGRMDANDVNALNEGEAKSTYLFTNEIQISQDFLSVFND